MAQISYRLKLLSTVTYSLLTTVSILVMPENNLMMLNLSTASRSFFPISSSQSREVRGIRLFRAISRKLTRRSNDDFIYTVDGDSRSSSSDSSSSTSIGQNSRLKRDGENNVSSGGDSGFQSVSPNHMSSSSSDDGSDDVQSTQRHHHSTSAESIRKVFQNLSLNTRSQSCTNTKDNSKLKKSNKKTIPKRILRAPVTYTYVKGLSGLPTQRVAKNQNRIYMSNTCGCNIQYMAGLNR